MQDLLAAAILSVAGVFLALTTLIVINKLWRETVAQYRRSRRVALEPIVLRFAHGNHPSLLAALGGRVPALDRASLETVLLDHVQRVRGIERERLGAALDELGYVDRYLDQLDSSRWWVRADGAEKLGLAGATRATAQLIRALQDEVSEVRMRAAKALGALGGTTSARPLIRALSEPNRWSAIRLADILTSMGRQVVDELLDLFQDLPLPGKLSALDIVARIRPLRALNWLHERMTDTEADVRARACHALGAIGDPSSGPALVAALEDEAWPVRAMAAKALGRIRHDAAIPRLATRLRDSEWWVRSNAAESMRHMGAKGLAALETALDDEDNYARHQAVLMLEEAGVVDRRASMLARPEGVDKEEARALLRRVIRVGQTGRLQNLADEHPDRRVREALVELLGEAPAGQEASP